MNFTQLGPNTMAMRIVTTLLLLPASASISTCAAVADDEAALLAFKAAAVRGSYGDVLASWNRSTTGGGAAFCHWEGVMCGSKHWPPTGLLVSATYPPSGFST